MSYHNFQLSTLNSQLALIQLLPEAFRQPDVADIARLLEEWSDVLWLEAGNAAADWRYEERQLGMFLGLGDEVVHVGTDSFGAALHGWDGIASALHADTLTHYGSETSMSYAGSAAAVHSGKVAAKYKHFVFL